MGPVSTLVLDRVRRQIDENHLVVWFDPERHYEGILPALTGEGIPVERFDGSVFALRSAKLISPMICDTRSTPPTMCCIDEPASCTSRVPASTRSVDEPINALISRAASALR